MQLITDEYRKLNENLHENNKHYGISGVNYLDEVIQILKSLNTQDLLDYGCGKSTLAHNLPFTIKQYDPAVKKYSAMPHPADVVVCTDVLEHVEPDLLDNVLTHIASLTKKRGYLSVCTREAKKKLTDGRNAHLIIENNHWWIKKILFYFDIIRFQRFDDTSIFMVEPINLVNGGSL